MDVVNSLQQGLQALQLELPESTQTQLLNYLTRLEQWNQVYNLTAVRNKVDMVPKHVLDSLAILPYLGNSPILDVGTGAGLPGLLLAIATPNQQFVLLDSQAKKIRFVRQVLIELEINNVELVCSRIETFQPSSLFNTIVTRAYASLYQFYTQTVRLCTAEGCWLAMKGNYPNTELAEMVNLPVHLSCLPLQIPQLSAQRHIVVMHPLMSSELNPAS